MQLKKKSFYNSTIHEDPAGEAKAAKEQEQSNIVGKKHKNFYYDIESMRLNAEKERIYHFKDIASRSAIIYYKILKQIIDKNIEQK